jgi:hypothetical protein
MPESNNPMTNNGSADEQKKPIPPTGSLWENRVTATGAVIAILALLFFIISQIVDVLNPAGNPYRGIWAFMVLPALLVAGLILIPVGWVSERRRRRRLYPDVHEWQRFPRLDLNSPSQRRILRIFGIGTLVVIPLIGISTYEGYHYTDSTQFCGQVCHQVMQPEFTAYSNSPHARVTCASCHIGPGASWFVKAKISGVRQVFAVMLDTYSRPIPTPIRDLRPARETCEQCHWPAKFFGSQLRTRYHFGPDENNTRQEISILVKTGGGDSSNGPASGIHWHMALSNRIEYVSADRNRQEIPWVRATDVSTGKVTVYRSDGKGSDAPPPDGEMRVVDCMDCHNRPTHIYQSPDRAVNVSLETGRIDRTLPFVKKIAVDALVAPYNTQEEADAKIADSVRGFYSKSYPELARTRQRSIDQAIGEVRAIYGRNFFPEMKVDWRAYPDNIGHMIFMGCFRCHDEAHVNERKVALTRNCDTCHDFGIKYDAPDGVIAYVKTRPEHPIKLEGTHATLPCSRCHLGGPAPERTCAGCHQLQSRFRDGKSPLIPGLKGMPPSAMAGLDCESCHDLSQPQTSEALRKHCEACHDKGYGDVVQTWLDDAAAGRGKAAAAIEGLRKSAQAMSDKAARQAALNLADQLEAALKEVDKAGVQHNTEFGDAVYQRIIELTTSGR